MDEAQTLAECVLRKLDNDLQLLAGKFASYDESLVVRAHYAEFLPSRTIELIKQSSASEPTSQVKVIGNLNSRSAILQGSGERIFFPISEHTNNNMQYTSIIVPNADLKEGQDLTIMVPSGSFTFTYGGLSYSKPINQDAGLFGVTSVNARFNSGITDGDSFLVTTSWGWVVQTLTYLASGGNPALGQFNSLDSLCQAINEVDAFIGDSLREESKLYARVADGKLYVAPVNGNEAIKFIDVIGNITHTLQLFNTTTAEPDVVRFTTLENLNAAIVETGFLGTIATTIANAASLEIYNLDPLQGITFTSIDGEEEQTLPALSLHPTCLGPAYDPQNVSAPSMASGNVIPNYVAAFQIYDPQGELHNFFIKFLKVWHNKLAVEIIAASPSDVVLAGYSAVTGLVAYGTLTFNCDASLMSGDGNIAAPIKISWTNQANDNLLTFNWDAHGLTQYAQQSFSNITPDGVPVAGVDYAEIGADGTINLFFANGFVRSMETLYPDILAPGEGWLDF